MGCHFGSHFCTTIAAILVFAAPNRAAPQFGVFDFSIYTFPQSDGSTQFHLLVDSPQPSSTIHFPDGSTAVGLKFTDLSYNSFADLHNAAVGNWSVSFPANPTLGFPAENYTFGVSDFPESVVSSLPPSITAPTNGARVGPQFNLTWDWPAGVVPPSDVSVNFQLYRSGSFQGWKTSHFANVALSQVVTPVITGAPAPDETILRVGTYESSLAPYISAVSSDQSSPRYAFRVDSTISSYSLPIQVTVVPEPTTATLLLLGVLGCGWRRRWNS